MGRNLLELTYLLDAIYYLLNKILFMYCMPCIDDIFNRIFIFYVHLAKGIEKIYGPYSIYVPYLIYVHFTQSKDVRVAGNITFIHIMQCARKNTVKAVQSIIIWNIVSQMSNGFNDYK